MTAAAKLCEAQFFLELLDALEARKRPLANESSAAQEASYLLGAFLNSLYSALEHAKSSVSVAEVKAYKNARPDLLGGNGIRNVTVHERHVEASHAGYIPPSGNAVNFDFRRPPRLVQEEKARSNGAVLQMGPSYYFDYGGKPVHVTDLCTSELYELRKFLRAHGVATQSNG